MTGCMAAWVDVCVHGCVCGQLAMWITACRVVCTYRDGSKFYWFDSILAKKFQICMQRSRHTAVHALNHAHRHPRMQIRIQAHLQLHGWRCMWIKLMCLGCMYECEQFVIFGDFVKSQRWGPLYMKCTYISTLVHMQWNFLGLGRVQTRPKIWPAVLVFLKTQTEPGLFLENRR